jgi:hypothetical protein
MRCDLELPSDEVTQVAAKVANNKEWGSEGGELCQSQVDMECRSYRQDLEAFEGLYEFGGSIS